MGNWLSPRPFCHDHAATPPGRGSGRLPVSACICRRGSYSGITNTTKSGAPGIRGTSAAGGAAVYGELQHAVVTVGFGAGPASGAAAAVQEGNPGNCACTLAGGCQLPRRAPAE